jgi:hypothetical protein
MVLHNRLLPVLRIRLLPVRHIRLLPVLRIRLLPVRHNRLQEQLLQLQFLCH